MKTIQTVIICLLFCTNSIAIADLVFDDGGVHDIDYVVSDTAYVYDSDAGVSTQVNIMNGAAFSSWVIFDEHSQLNMTGGAIDGDNHTGALIVKGNSVAAISGGYIYDGGLSGYSDTNISGNAQFHICYVSGNASVVIGGNVQVNLLTLFDSPSVEINGGTFDDINALEGDLTIYGGTFNGFMNLENSEGLIAGGIFENGVQIGGDYVISGGSFEDSIIVNLWSTVEFQGNNFEIDGQAVDSQSTFEDYGLTLVEVGGLSYFTGVLTGTLCDGTAINQAIYLSYSSVSDDIGNLQFVPEPASMWLLLAGCGFLARRKSSRKS